MLFYSVSEFGVLIEIEKFAQPQLLLMVFLNSTFDILNASRFALSPVALNIAGVCGYLCQCWARC